MQVIKRSGEKEEFNPKKIENAILKAFEACEYKLGKVDKHKIKKFCEEFEELGDEELTVEEIQDSVEKYLCKRCFPVGKAYMLYREQHKQARLISDKLKYIHKYAGSSESATNLSNTDDNANSNQKNVASLESEVYKDLNRIIQRGEMKQLLAEIGSSYRDQYVKDLEHHIIYQHD